MIVAINLLLLLPLTTNAVVDLRPKCVDYNVESKDLDTRLTRLEHGKQTVIKAKGTSKFNIGNVKLGDLTEKGNCNYRSRHVPIDASGEKKKVKVVTHYHDDKSTHAEYIQTGENKYKALVKDAIPLNLDDERLPDNVGSFHDEAKDLHRIKVNDALHEFKLGRVTLNGHTVEDLPESLERIVYSWNSEDGRKVFRIDSHLNDNRILSQKFMEESPGSKKFKRLEPSKYNGIRLIRKWESPKP
uniref:Uncharacterized protein n=1 Tax=Theileria uilenbergi TaxID=507731 RepID=B7UBE1_9APIC|nr:unknown [Theileria uilenbergi]